MNVLSFPTCCGINILSGFGNTSTAMDTTKYSIEDIDKFVLQGTINSKGYGKSITLIAINEEQRAIMRGCLRKRGYKRLMKAYHPNHNSVIYLYGKALNENLKPNEAQQETQVADEPF